MTRWAIIAVLLVAGCENDVQQRQLMLTEANTGCQYIGRQAGNMVPGDLKPLLDGRGKQICNRPVAEEADAQRTSQKYLKEKS